MSFTRIVAALLLVGSALPLAGCPVYPGHPLPPPTAYPKMPYEIPEAPAQFGGPSLAEAYQQADRWMDGHYPGALLIRAESLQVDRTGRASARGWTFKYALGQSQPVAMLPVAPPTPRPKYVLAPGEEGGAPADDQMSIMPIVDPLPPTEPEFPLPMPKPAPERYMVIGVDGTGHVLAPEDADGELQRGKIDFARTVAVSRLLAEIDDLGASIGSAGARLTLYTRGGRTVFEIDPGVASRGSYEPSADTEPYPYEDDYSAQPAVMNQSAGLVTGNSNSGAGYSVKCVAPPAPRPYQTAKPGVLYRGTYVFDAYTAELISRPHRL